MTLEEVVISAGDHASAAQKESLAALEVLGAYLAGRLVVTPKSPELQQAIAYLASLVKLAGEGDTGHLETQCMRWREAF